jgi:hypothetical protein
MAASSDWTDAPSKPRSAKSRSALAISFSRELSESLCRNVRFLVELDLIVLSGSKAGGSACESNTPLPETDDRRF